MGDHASLRRIAESWAQRVTPSHQDEIREMGLEALVVLDELVSLNARANAAELRIERLLHADCNVCHHMAERAAICSKCGPLCPQCARALEVAATDRAEKAERERDAAAAMLSSVAGDLSSGERAEAMRIAGEALASLSARAEKAEAALAEIHTLLGRGDHGPGGNAFCARDAILSIREGGAEAEREAEAAEQRAEKAEALLAEFQEAANHTADINCPRCHVSALVPLVEGGCVMGERCPACNATWRSM